MFPLSIFNNKPFASKQVSVFCVLSPEIIFRAFFMLAYTAKKVLNSTIFSCRI